MQNDQTSKNRHIFEGNQHERKTSNSTKLIPEKTINRTKRHKTYTINILRKPKGNYIHETKQALKKNN